MQGLQVILGGGRAGKGVAGHHQWCCEAPAIPNGLGVRPDTHLNVGVAIYICPSEKRPGYADKLRASLS